MENRPGEQVAYPEGSVPPLGSAPAEEPSASPILAALHDLIIVGRRVAAGLLAGAGAISVEHARAMAKLPEFSKKERANILRLLKWCKQTGVIVPVAWAQLWGEAHGWGNERDKPAT